jgi:hypothetical protein
MKTMRLKPSNISKTVAIPIKTVLIRPPMIATFRGDQRSLIAPPTNINKARGIAAATNTVPTANPEAVFWSTNHVNETIQNLAADKIKVCPNHSQRKLGKYKGDRSIYSFSLRKFTQTGLTQKLRESLDLP